MTERDWRIFREDFSIAYKGAAMGPNSLPIRNWKEANLPDNLMKAIERQARPSLLPEPHACLRHACALCVSALHGLCDSNKAATRCPSANGRRPTCLTTS